MKREYKSIIAKSVGGAFAIIGSVIGAGFITGREILTFFHGQSPILLFLLLFLLFFVGITAIFSVKNPLSTEAVNMGNKAILILNVLSVASMCGATESLAVDLKIGTAFPFWSIGILLLSVLICNRGMKGLSVFNAVLVPIMLIVIFSFLFTGKGVEQSSNAISLLSIKPWSAIEYAGMNILLTQPLISDIRHESFNLLNSKNGGKTAVITAFIVALLLSLSVSVFLSVLPRESLMSDIPILYVAGKSKAAFYLVSFTVAAGIITTLVGSLYPLIRIKDKGKRSKEYLVKRRGILRTLCVCVISLCISRLGFSVIVERIYPALGAVAVVYYAFTLVFLPIFQRVARLRTSRRQEGTKAECRSLQGRV